MNTEVKIKQPQIETVKDISPYHQRITLGPFERGYGYTLGNAIRRVLLSGVPGFAATQVKIDGVEHQYSTIAGISEDVIEIILNIKGIAFRIDGGDSAKVELHAEGPGNITAGDIKLPGQVTILNPDHHIALLSQDAKLDMEIKIEGGRGYRPAGGAHTNKTYGTIELDASFSPVKKVAIEVESTRVDSRTDLDRLIIDLQTNGVHSPEDMIRYAGKLLIEQLTLFANLDESSSDLEAIGNRDEQIASSRFYEPLDVLNLNVRYINNLKQESVFYIGELVRMSEKELLKTPRLGKKSVDEIKIALAEIGLSLDMDIGKFEPESPGK